MEPLPVRNFMSTFATSSIWLCILFTPRSHANTSVSGVRNLNFTSVCRSSRLIINFMHPNNKVMIQHPPLLLPAPSIYIVPPPSPPSSPHSKKRSTIPRTFLIASRLATSASRAFSWLVHSVPIFTNSLERASRSSVALATSVAFLRPCTRVVSSSVFDNASCNGK